MWVSFIQSVEGLNSTEAADLEEEEILPPDLNWSQLFLTPLVDLPHQILDLPSPHTHSNLFLWRTLTNTAHLHIICMRVEPLCVHCSVPGTCLVHSRYPTKYWLN